VNAAICELLAGPAVIEPEPAAGDDAAGDDAAGELVWAGVAALLGEAELVLELQAASNVRAPTARPNSRGCLPGR
jgi:hypothetical protein